MKVEMKLPPVTIAGEEYTVWLDDGTAASARTRPATAADLAAVIAALPEDERGTVIAELVKQGHWHEIDEAADVEAQKILDMSDDELQAEIAASCEHPERWERWSKANGRWIRMVADATARTRDAAQKLAAAIERATSAERELAAADEWRTRFWEKADDLAAEREAHAKTRQLFGAALLRLQAFGDHAFDLSNCRPPVEVHRVADSEGRPVEHDSGATAGPELKRGKAWQDSPPPPEATCHFCGGDGIATYSDGTKSTRKCHACNGTGRAWEESERRGQGGPKT